MHLVFHRQVPRAELRVIVEPDFLSKVLREDTQRMPVWILMAEVTQEAMRQQPRLLAVAELCAA